MQARNTQERFCMAYDTRVGNAAKLYCLAWIEQFAQATERPLKLLDLGCGAALYAVDLLARCPNIEFVGIEPLTKDVAQARQNLRNFNATIIEGYAYAAIRPQLPHESYDIVLSFSVFEHVYERLAYLQFVHDCLSEGGFCLMNYDAGHFHSTHWKERAKTWVGGVLARLGNQAYYQAFVREADFKRWVKDAQLAVVEAKMFNTSLKGIYRTIPEAHKPAYIERWLALELWLNELGIAYHDGLSKAWVTRNYILQRTKPVDNANA